VLSFDAAFGEPHEGIVVIPRSAKADVIVSGRIDAWETEDAASPRGTPARLSGVILFPLTALVVMMSIQIENCGGSAGSCRDGLQHGVSTWPSVPTHCHRIASGLHDLTDLGLNVFQCLAHIQVDLHIPTVRYL